MSERPIYDFDQTVLVFSCPPDYETSDDRIHVRLSAFKNSDANLTCLEVQPVHGTSQMITEYWIPLVDKLVNDGTQVSADFLSRRADEATDEFNLWSDAHYAWKPNSDTSAAMARINEALAAKGLPLMSAEHDLTSHLTASSVTN